MNDEPVQLILYDAAKSALAEVRRVDEVKNIRDKMVAYQAYAKQARDRQMLNDATDIRMRAERRAGELIRQFGERRGGEHSSGERTLPSNKELGVTKAQSHDWQSLSKLAQEDFEKRVLEAQKRANHALDGTTKAEKQARRAAHEAALAERVLALPTKRYAVIMADPPWQFIPWSDETGMDRAPENHYATSPLRAIKDRDIASISADDCVLFLWATVPMLHAALDVMAAWGFDYRSHCVWLKEREGLGYWFRNIHELLLVGVRGKPPAPAQGRQWPSAFDANQGDHSEKPEEFYQLVEDYFPTVPKIELYARQRRAGWDAYGAEAPLDLEAASGDDQPRESDRDGDAGGPPAAA
jgi:N6-adenosine-specific RNA methylase IME4